MCTRSHRLSQFVLLLSLALLFASDSTTAQTAPTGTTGAGTGNRLRHAIAVEQGTATIMVTTPEIDKPNFFAMAFEQIILGVLNSLNQGIGTLGNSLTAGGLGLSVLNSTGLANTTLSGMNSSSTSGQ